MFCISAQTVWSPQENPGLQESCSCWKGRWPKEQHGLRVLSQKNGLLEVLPGDKNQKEISCQSGILGEYKSYMMWDLLKDFKGAAYLTVLTREFSMRMCCQKKCSPGSRTIQRESQTYIVTFHNKKEEGLHQKQEIIIARNRREHQVSYQWESVRCR